MPEALRSAVFVHGAGAGGWEWGAWARVFEAAGVAVLAPDLQPAPDGMAATRLADYAARVGDWVRAAPRPRLLVGASLGGLLAAMHADAADALVLVNPMPPAGLPGATPRPTVVRWGRGATLAGTRRALAGADDAAALFAFRRWRDESGAVLDEAARGQSLARPALPVLVITSLDDEDVPPATGEALARQWQATLWREPGTHVAPLLGRQAPALAARALAWANKMGSENINDSIGQFNR